MENDACKKMQLLAPPEEGLKTKATVKNWREVISPDDSRDATEPTVLNP